ncbi:20993_t:CDS:2 [Entrophospora sp. SA101]|nr:20993_t:CDS:2 [Entrophospora sp. SA101]
MASIELKFSGTFQKDDYLKDFSCGYCQQYLSKKDISQGNYRLYVSDYANEVNKDDYFSERNLAVAFLSKPSRLAISASERLFLTR